MNNPKIHRPTEPLAETCRILAVGLIRRHKQKSSPENGQNADCRLDFSPEESGPAVVPEEG